MKYIIELPDELAEATKEYWDKTVGLPLEPYTEPNSIEDVWQFLAFLIDGMDSDEKYECFGMSNSYRIVSTMSYQEAKDKYNKWLKQRNEIKVGDEVTDKDGYKGIATFVYTGCGLFDVLWDDGSVTEDVDKKDFFKTGRHFPEVVELLKKMKENYEEISTR